MLIAPSTRSVLPGWPSTLATAAHCPDAGPNSNQSVRPDKSYHQPIGRNEIPDAATRVAPGIQLPHRAIADAAHQSARQNRRSNAWDIPAPFAPRPTYIALAAAGPNAPA